MTSASPFESDDSKARQGSRDAMPPAQPASAQETPTPATVEAEAAIAEQAGRIALAWLVLWGTLAVVVVGGCTFGWLAWLLSHQPAPWHDHRGWWAWLSSVNGGAFFDAARTTATVLAIVGVGGAALVAYRRQATTELTYQFTVRAHAVAIDAQKTAAEQLILDSKKYELDRQRHDLETQRRVDDQERELRTRFTTVAEQLGSDQFAVRHAAIFALASLADAWYRFGSETERQVCVDLFCAHLRSPSVPETPLRSPTADAEDTQIRTAMVALIRSHRPIHAGTEDAWTSCSLDLSGADLSGFYFYETDLSSAILDDANLSRSNMIRADLSNAMMTRVNVTGTEFTEATMTDVKMYSCQLDVESDDDALGNQAIFREAKLQGAWFTNANLAYSDFADANLTGAHFDRANLAPANFEHADLTGATFYRAKLQRSDFAFAVLHGTSFVAADITDALFIGVQYDEHTKWPRGVIPPTSNAPVAEPESANAPSQGDTDPSPSD